MGAAEGSSGIVEGITVPAIGAAVLAAGRTVVWGMPVLEEGWAKMGVLMSLKSSERSERERECVDSVSLKEGSRWPRVAEVGVVWGI